MAGSPTFFPEGHDPRPYDTEHVLLLKILGALNDGGGGGGGTVLAFTSTVPTNTPGASDPKIKIGIGDYVGYLWVWDDGFTNTWVQIPGGP